MRVGLVVSANKFTGAAAVAEGWCRALLAIDVDARILFVGGANLERRLTGCAWAEAALAKERRVADIRSNLRTLRRLAADSDAVLCHLPHDHFELIAAGAHRRTRLVRAFRRPQHLRRDPLHRAIARRVAGAIAPFEAAVKATENLTRAPSAAVAACVEDRFHPAGGAPAALSDGDPRPLLGMVGKVAPGRGFDLLLEAAAGTGCGCRILAVGHGELQPALAQRARDLRLEERLIWAGKREDDLPALYRSMDAVLFAAPGSDWGHRTITEAQACGRPVIAVDWPGVCDLVEHDRTGIIVARDPQAIARAMDRIAGDPAAARRIGEAAAAAVNGRRRLPIAEKLVGFLGQIA